MSVDRLGSWHPPTTVHPSQLHAPLPPGYTYGDPIPAFTTQTPGELLDNYYSERRNDPDWTDPNGPLSRQVEVHLNYPRNAVQPIGSRGLVGEWERPNGLAAEPVPVCVALDGPQVVVKFKNLDLECPSKGIPVAELYSRNKYIVKDAEDIVDGFGRMDLKFVIAWPGYASIQFTIRTVASNGRPLTRFALARKIMMTYAVLFTTVETERVLPNRVGFYNIALHQGHNSRADSLGVQLNQLHLVGIRGTIGGNWVADVDIV